MGWTFSLIAMVLVMASCVSEGEGKRTITLEMGKQEVKKGSVRFGRNTMSPLYGGISFAEFYVNIYLGTPPQLFAVQVDTGSSDLGVPSVNCLNCVQANERLFFPAKSSTFRNVSCTSSLIICPQCPTKTQCFYQIAYGDGSGFTANVFQDVAQIGGVTVDQVFGLIMEEHAGTDQTQFQQPGVDGILGIGYRTISSIYANTLFANLVTAGKIDNAFSICMNPTGGVLALGGSSNSHAGDFQYTPIIAHTYYVVYLKSILFGGKALPGVTSANFNGGNTGGTIVDSGTTLLLIAPTPYKALHAAFYAFCSANPSLPCGTPGNGLFDFQCAQLTTSQLNSFPSMTFLFGSASTISVTIPGGGYFIPCNQPGTYTVGIDGSLNEGNAILGDIFMQNFEVMFDVGNNRIGFSPVVNCAYRGTDGVTPPSSSSSSSTTAIVVTVVALGVIASAIVGFFLYKKYAPKPPPEKAGSGMYRPPQETL